MDVGLGVGVVVGLGVGVGVGLGVGVVVGLGVWVEVGLGVVVGLGEDVPQVSRKMCMRVRVRECVVRSGVHESRDQPFPALLHCLSG